MDIEKLIERLNDWNEKYISNLCGDRTIKCEEYCIKDDCLIVKAATALSTLQGEIEAFSMFALGNTVTVSGNREVITFCGVSCDEAMERVTDYPQLKMRLERAEKALSKLQSILYNPLIIEQNGILRPVKRTSRQDVYKTVLAAQAAAGITGRWFPKWMKEE